MGIPSANCFGSNLSRWGHSVAVKVGKELLDSSAVDPSLAVDPLRLTSEDERSVRALLLACPDKTYRFTDRISFILMRDLGLCRALAPDKDFLREGFQLLPQ